MASITAILIGILSGLVTASVGYLKSRKAEEFEPAKFFQTLTVGAVIGLICGVTGWSYDAAAEFLKQTGLITLIEYLKKAAYRHLFSGD